MNGGDGMFLDRNAMLVLLAAVPPEHIANQDEWRRNLIIKGRQLGWSETHRRLLTGEDEEE